MFHVSALVYQQNNVLYREVDVKADIPEEELVTEHDKYRVLQCPGGAKTELRFVEGYAAGQGHLPPSKRKKKTRWNELKTTDDLKCILLHSGHYSEGSHWMGKRLRMCIERGGGHFEPYYNFDYLPFDYISFYNFE